MSYLSFSCLHFLQFLNHMHIQWITWLSINSWDFLISHPIWTTCPFFITKHIFHCYRIISILFYLFTRETQTYWTKTVRILLSNEVHWNVKIIRKIESLMSCRLITWYYLPQRYSNLGWIFLTFPWKYTFVSFQLGIDSFQVEDVSVKWNEYVNYP